MSLILSLETSTSVCSVALHNQGKVLAVAEVHIEQSHASKLAVLIDQIKKVAGVESHELRAVAISSGPGSYTGLRIGTSTAKGLCFALGIPLIAVNTLELMTSQVNSVNVGNAWLCPMIDARRMEVYCLLADANLSIIQNVEAKVIDENSFCEFLEEKQILFFGDGALKCSTVIKHTNAKFIDGVYPSASQLGVIAFQKFTSKQVEDLTHFEPYYLKEFQLKKATDKI